MTLAEQLEQALTAVAESLEAGVTEAASSAAEQVDRICAEGAGSGLRLSADELFLLARAQARAEAAAEAARDEVARVLGLASSGRRATLAYGP